MSRASAALESAPLLHSNPSHAHSHAFHPRTVTKICDRIKALTLELLPIQVDLDAITSPTSSILTPSVVDAYSRIAGDFHRCLPFALLEARRYFKKQAYLNPSDSDENEGRKLAVEALARKIVARTPMSEQYSLLSARFTVIEADGDESLPLSALESAVDQHATFFLSSGESQRCVFALWRGLLVQKLKDDGSIEYEPYKPAREHGGFSSHFASDRVAVPRYQFFFRIALWVLFVVCYTIAVQTPDREFGLEDIILYVQVAGYLLEAAVRIYKIGVWASLSFWTIHDLCLFGLLCVAFGYRMADLSTHDTQRSYHLRLTAFQWLSSAAPLVWMKLVTVFDLYQYFGILQIVMFRMMRESLLFFTLLGLLAIGFGQSLAGLDNLDTSTALRLAGDDDGPVRIFDKSTEVIVHSLIQGLLGSPQFELFEKGSPGYPFSMVLYYGWAVLTLVLLLNILVALFGSAYQECTDEAVPTFMAFFAGKTISAIRAPDQFVYVAPFNLIEIVILPLELVLSRERYAQLNRYIMSTLFCVPLCAIALFETHFDRSRSNDYRALMEEPDDFGEQEEDPEPCYKSDDMRPGDDEEMKIATTSFEELKGMLPDLTRSIQSDILSEIKRLHARLDELDAGKKDTTVVDAKDSAGSVKKDGDKKGSSSSSNQAHSGKGGKKK